MMVGQMSRWSIYEGSTEATEPGRAGVGRQKLVLAFTFTLVLNCQALWA